MIVQGIPQQYGIDYDEIFAPVVKHTTLHTLLIFAGKQGLLFKHWDAKTAFLNEELKEVIYMKQPPRFKERQEENWVYKLNRTMYRLKQSAKAWHKKLKSVFTDLNFKVYHNDSCLFKTINGGPTIYMVVYIDDMVVACKSAKRIEMLKTAFNEQFAITDLSN